MAAGNGAFGEEENALLRVAGTLRRSEFVRTLTYFCIFEIAFYFAYRYGMAFSQRAASPFWFPDSVLLCAFLTAPRKHWWFYILAPLPIRLFSEVAQDLPTWFLLCTYAVDTVTSVATAILMRRFMTYPTRLLSVRDFAIFVLIAALFVPVLSAFAGAELRTFLGNPYWISWEQWFLGDALTQLVVTPAILCCIVWQPHRFRLPSLPRALEALLVCAGLVFSSYAAFHTDPSLSGFELTRFSSPVPFLFWAVIRFGTLGASAAAATITFFAVRAAIAGVGPFLETSPADTAFALQNFLLVRAAPLYLVAALIEQKDRVDSSLRESEHRFREMANSAPVMIWMYGTDKRCEFVNQGWLDFTGRTFEQEVGEGWLAGVHSDDLPKLERCYAAFDAREPFDVEYRLRRHDGEYRWVRDIGVPRKGAHDEFAGYIGTAIDVSDRKQLEENTRHLAHVQRLALMGELTAAIAHEIRQPLSAILNNADAAGLLLDTDDPPLDEVRHMLSDIQRDDLRANEVLNRIRNFVRKRETQIRALDLRETIQDTLRFVSEDAAVRHVKIRADIAAGLPLALGDRVQVQQVLLNLIVNGMDAMDTVPGEIRELTVRARPRSGNCVEVSVSDRGTGIAEDVLPHLFDSFFTTRKEGMGLGLSVAWTIVIAHSGRIWAMNNPDGGATFQFTLPLAPIQHGSVPAHEARKARETEN